MRTAIVSDIHGNLTAFEALLADLRTTAPDLVLHGGDLADSGSSPVEIIDTIRSLAWPGVAGNTDEMLALPSAFATFAAARPELEHIWRPLREMAAFTRDRLGEDRLAWLRSLPAAHLRHDLALVHATLQTRWRAPSLQAPDAELHESYCTLPQSLLVYGHIHTPFVRVLNKATRATWRIANAGSVGQPLDGDRRASYLLLDDETVTIRRVEYDLNRELERLTRSGLPHAAWLHRILQTAAPQLP